MKKLPKSISIFLSPSRLFLNDLELLEEVYKDNCQSYKINTKDYEIDCVEEIKQLGSSKFNFIQINSYNPSVTLTISSDFTEIYSSTNNILSTGIITKLQELLKHRRSPLIYSTSTWSFAIAGFIEPI